VSLRHFLGSARWRVILAANRRDFPLSESGPFVSFTFDDFPQTALHVGGTILKDYGVCGTYYAAMGLMGRTNSLGRQFSASDLQGLLREGHELGSHSFGHLSCRSTPLHDFEEDVLKGITAVEQITGSSHAHHFSYPFGHATLRSKRRIGAMVSSCRGNMPGINRSVADLNLLRANALYSSSFKFDSVDRLLTTNAKCRGWLIFYTHDICEHPSPYGCTPAEFESVVRLATAKCRNVLPVGQAISTVAQRTPDPTDDGAQGA
jgi:peptidoglycan/xylan/chitin deacetylase (PgdA/CDA1 family)